MACNCTTKEQLDILFDKYGYGNVELKKLSFPQKARYLFNKAATSVAMLLVIPFLFAFVLYKTLFGDGKISLRKFFGLKYVGEQQ